MLVPFQMPLSIAFTHTWVTVLLYVQCSNIMLEFSSELPHCLDALGCTSLSQPLSWYSAQVHIQGPVTLPGMACFHRRALMQLQEPGPCSGFGLISLGYSFLPSLQKRKESSLPTNLFSTSSLPEMRRFCCENLC